jgi:hypothetical protein
MARGDVALRHSGTVETIASAALCSRPLAARQPIVQGIRLLGR